MPEGTQKTCAKKNVYKHLWVLYVGTVYLSLLCHGDLIAYYSFENTLDDILGDPAKSFTGGPGGEMSLYISAFRGQGLSFDGIDDYAVTDSFVTHDFSIVVWVNTQDTYPGGDEKFWNGKGIVNAEAPGCTATTGDWGLALQSTDKAGFGIGGDCSPTEDVISTTPINDGLWHFICCTRDGTTGEYAIYVDQGGPEETLSYLPGVDRKIVPMYLGSVNEEIGKYLDGTIDELMFFDHVLTQTQIDLIREYGCVWGPAVPIYPLPLPDPGGLNIPADIDLQWTSLYQGPGDLEYTLYLDTKQSRIQDPNLSEKGLYLIWQEGVLPASATDPNAFWSYLPIQAETAHYWRVDTLVWEPNENSPDPNNPLLNIPVTIPGPVWSFQGAPETVSLTDPENVYYLPDLDTHQPIPGFQAPFTVTITTELTLTDIQWLKDDNPLTIDGSKYQVDNEVMAPGVTDSTLTISNVDPNDAGSYACRAFVSGAPSKTSDPATLYVSLDVLRHRYPFNQTYGDTAVYDVINSADGQIVDPNTENLYFQSGQIVFEGPYSNENDTSDDPDAHFVDLPNDLLSSLGNNMTLMVWFTWEDPNESVGQRVFDFGLSAAGEGFSAPNSQNQKYIYLTPKSDQPGQEMRAQFHMVAEKNLDDSATGPIGQEICVAAVWDGVNDELRMYVNGQQKDLKIGLPDLLHELDDRNNWLGRSQWPDPLFKGRLNEFRIYSVPLSDLWIQAYFEAGPNDPDVDPCLAKPLADQNDDCIVDLADFALLAEDWLKCGLLSCLYPN